ncbi:MAG: glycosyltransferase [Solirubrobacteraceae bacterium]
MAAFAPFLREHGVELEYRPALTDDEYRVLGSHASAAHKACVLARGAARAAGPRPAHDALLVHRLRLLAPLPGIDPPRHLAVYDLDDALFLGSTAVVNRRFAWAKQEARRCVIALRRARLVIAGNVFLADHARRYARHVEIVPSCVDPEHQPTRTHSDAEVVTIGWIGSSSTSPYLAPVLPVIERLHRRGAPIRLITVGAHVGMRAPWLQSRHWSLAREAEDLASFDIGIMPLPDSDWARGKCGYKVLQYFSAGVPAVASPVGVTTELVAEGRGALATSPQEWEQALSDLVGDVAARRERGLAGRSFVQAHYSYRRWAPELAGLLRANTG